MRVGVIVHLVVSVGIVLVFKKSLELGMFLVDILLFVLEELPCVLFTSKRMRRKYVFSVNVEDFIDNPNLNLFLLIRHN